ncbi:MAG: leucine--tRNA ligase [Leptospiraceae bacterium]|nr:leucine--tRNA ligase [Leptospiraceae bacterium]
MAYPFAELEPRWQKYWLENKTFLTPGIDSGRPKYYVLDMFPYPSGAGLHVGHPEGYTATDIVARYKRMQGFSVLHPMGWDAFGLPAERYAMQTGIHPSLTTAQNIDNFRRQLQALGFSYDWDREVDTTRPEYYKHTQRIFLLLFDSWYDKDLKKARPIQELPVPDFLQGDDREKYINSRRLAYVADVPVNWCAALGTVLANEEVDEWVGKGYTVERRPMRQWMLRITEYADRLLEDLQYVDWPAGTLELQKNWIGRSHGAQVRFEWENTSLAEATGHKHLEVFTTRPDTLYGVTFMVIAPEHPFTIQIASDDKRQSVTEYIKATALKTDLDRQTDAGKGLKSGVDTGAKVLHPLTGEAIPVYTADYVLMGYGTGAIMAVPGHDERDFQFAREFSLKIKKVVQGGKEEDEVFSGEGIAINSVEIDGLPTSEAKLKIIEFLEKKHLGKRKVQYKLRDWLFSRQRYWGEPIPISYDENGNFAAEKIENLPLLLPESSEFQPADTGESPLARLENWIFYTDERGRKLKRESNTMPQWAGSCWYYLRYTDPDNNEEPAGKEQSDYWLNNGVDLYIGGAEHAVLHLLYARFWHKVLYDYGMVNCVEPFQKLVHQGIILGEDNSKMSKSRGNVVNPDDVVAEYGADSFRMFEMFMGPLEQMKPWSSKSIEGVYRFLSRVWRLMIEEDGSLSSRVTNVPQKEDAIEIDKSIHRSIAKVTQDIERLSFNTAISQLMICLNEISKKEALGLENCKTFVLLLSPFAPHITEELWQRLGEQTTLAYHKWPVADSSKLVDDEIEIVFQVNGKIRGKGNFALNAPEDEVKKAALGDAGVLRAINEKPVRKIIVVPNKIVSIVV